MICLSSFLFFCFRLNIALFYLWHPFTMQLIFVVLLLLTFLQLTQHSHSLHHSLFFSIFEAEEGEEVKN